MVFLNVMDIPDQHFQLNLGVTSLDLALTDLHVKNVEILKDYVNMFDDGSFNAGVDGVSLEIALNWGFQQTSYPYLSDGGSGKIIMKNAELKASLKAAFDNGSCPGHMHFETNRIEFYFQMLKVMMEGGNSWIYQSLIDIILNAIEGDLKSMMSDILVKAIQSFVSPIIEEDGYYLFYDHYDKVIKDDRFVAKMDVKDKMATILFSGYTYHWDHLDDEYMN